jgi:hypothetical protein
MAHGTRVQAPSLYSLIPLEDFKAILGFDDREDKLSRFCLTTATFTIEQYCRRRLLRKKHFEFLSFHGDHLFPLREYPVRELLAVYQTHALRESIIIENDLCHTIPDCGIDEECPFTLSVSPAIRLVRGLSGIKLYYWAGFKTAEVWAPGGARADLASACLELAAWNHARYRGRRIGITGSIQGAGKDGEHLEASMPENVRQLLEPYRRKTI